MTENNADGHASRCEKYREPEEAKAMEPSLQIAAATGIGAGIGAFIGSISTSINAWRDRISNNRRANREWAVEIATAYWNAQIEYAKYRSTLGEEVSVRSVDVYLISLLGLADYISDKSVTEKNAAEISRRLRQLSDNVIAGAEGYEKDRKGK